jgi:hypothetical protein
MPAGFHSDAEVAGPPSPEKPPVPEPELALPATVEMMPTCALA